ncbi:hypothetical protein GCM10022251_73350 [Phytohabitans flavus]|uniref:Uncharacterized protein n=1 Tax=Phytohabitans flavus TaxID=1076124 RepID=A0A6F8XKD4_9ACTN|nr:hypothetical protein [Phytohabitans flavus]BCB74272.1 hypothetical protein Pflav_006820 [Phytohabitans flavus]
MDSDSPTAWVFARFEDLFLSWVDRELPDEATQTRVIDWMRDRRADPFAGMLRDLNHPNLWFGRVPHTLDKAGTLVTVSYQILMRTRIVRCMSIGRVGLPM